MNDVFQEIKIKKVSDKIADQLTELIKAGKLAPGDRLPSERQLIELMGVGRSSLREALNRLEILGYVEIRKRKGIFVKSISPGLHLDPLQKVIQDDLQKIIQLYEVRSDIEQANTYHAALNRTDQDLAEMRACLEGMNPAGTAPYFSWENDRAFHCAIARATGNIFRIHVLMNIFDFSRELIQSVIEDFGNTRENLTVLWEQHMSLVEAIEKKDADQARKMMNTHLEGTNQQFVLYFNRSNSQSKG